MDQELAEGHGEVAAEGSGAEAARVARLERSVRRLWIALVAVSLAAGGALVSVAGTPGRIAVEELAIEGADGAVQLVLRAGPGGGSIDQFDAQGRLRISQGIEPDGKAGIALLDGQGARRIGAAAFGDGDAGLAILDRAGKVRIQLLSEADGLAGTVHLDPQGRKRIETFAAADGRALESFLDPSGSVRLQLGTRQDGSAISTQPDAGEPVAELASE